MGRTLPRRPTPASPAPRDDPGGVTGGPVTPRRSMPGCDGLARGFVEPHLPDAVDAVARAGAAHRLVRGHRLSFLRREVFDLLAERDRLELEPRVDLGIDGAAHRLA